MLPVFHKVITQEEVQSSRMLFLKKDGDGSVHLFTFYLLYLNPAHKSAGPVFYSVASFHVAVLWFLLYTGMESFCNFVVRGTVWTIMIRSSALPYDHLHLFVISIILEFCLGELGKAAASHPCEHKVPYRHESCQHCAQQHQHVTL